MGESPRRRKGNSMSAERTRPLKLGLYIPNGDGPMGNGIARWRDVLAMARRAEEVGFDSVWVADHTLFRFDDVPTHGRWECWSLLSALAASTSRVEIGPLVSCMGFRNPALLAKIADTVDEISGGRLILALGAGWHEPEFTAYGYPFDHRASRFEDGVRIVHDLLRTGRSDFHGRYASVNDCELRPRGPRPAGPPIMIGTNGERLLRLTAQFADAWNTTWLRDPSEIIPLRAAVDAACHAVDRDPATLARTACVYLDLPSHDGRWSWSTPQPPQPRRPDEAADILRGFADEGISHVMLWLDPCSVRGIDDFAETIALLDRA
jgi:alkanesulfonate monooxygenase SsuD/methylene tetrahydromethanopterin reductase-like flavin-dependent oxidoreductase (luciferase family)